MKKPLPLSVRVWTWTVAAALVFLAVSRDLYYGTTALPGSIEALLRKLLVVETFAAILAMWADVLFVVGVGLVGIPMIVVRPRWVFRREGDIWGLRPWMHALAWLAIAVNHPFYLVNANVGAACLVSLPMIALASRRGIGIEAAVWAVFFGAFVALAPDAADRLSLVLLAGAVAYLARGLPRWLSRADCVTAGVLLMPVAQVSSGALGAELRLHRGRQVSEGMAYAYCESSERGKIYAMVPRCGTDWASIEECRDGMVEVIDASDATVVARHRVMSREYYGRIEQPVCLEDTIQVGMNRTVYEGERFLESALELDMDDPSRVRPHVLGEAGGHRIAYDPRDNVLFYVGDDVRRVHRFERETGAWSRWENEGPAAESIISAAIHPERRSLFTVSVDAPVREFRLDDMTLAGTYEHGAGTEIAVDVERDRLFVTGFFGLEVYDLETKRVLLRRRYGFLPRRPSFDTTHGLVFLVDFGRGKLLVLDGESLEPLDQIPLGIGGRYPHVSLDGRFLFAGSNEAHFVWDLTALAARLRSR